MGSQPSTLARDGLQDTRSPGASKHIKAASSQVQTGIDPITRPESQPLPDVFSEQQFYDSLPTDLQNQLCSNPHASLQASRPTRLRRLSTFSQKSLSSLRSSFIHNPKTENSVNTHANDTCEQSEAAVEQGLDTPILPSSPGEWAPTSSTSRSRHTLLLPDWDYTYDDHEVAKRNRLSVPLLSLAGDPLLAPRPIRKASITEDSLLNLGHQEYHSSGPLPAVHYPQYAADDDFYRRTPAQNWSSLGRPSLRHSVLGLSSYNRSFAHFDADYKDSDCREGLVPQDLVPLNDKTTPRLLRPHSDVLMYAAPMRKHSLRQPGVATRTQTTSRPQPRSDFPLQPSTPQAPKFVLGGDEDDPDQDIEYFAAQNLVADDFTRRALTPCEDNYKQIGAFKLGSLRIVNGIASPIDSPAEKKTKLLSPDRTATVNKPQSQLSPMINSSSGRSQPQAENPRMARAISLGGILKSIAGAPKTPAQSSDAPKFQTSIGPEFLKLELSSEPLFADGVLPVTKYELEATNCAATTLSSEVLDVRIDPMARSNRPSSTYPRADALQKDNGFASLADSAITGIPSSFGETKHNRLSELSTRSRVTADSGYGSMRSVIEPTEQTIHEAEDRHDIGKEELAKPASRTNVLHARLSKSFRRNRPHTNPAPAAETSTHVSSGVMPLSSPLSIRGMQVSPPSSSRSDRPRLSSPSAASASGLERGKRGGKLRRLLSGSSLKSSRAEKRGLSTLAHKTYGPVADRAPELHTIANSDDIGSRSSKPFSRSSSSWRSSLRKAKSRDTLSSLFGLSRGMPEIPEPEMQASEADNSHLASGRVHGSKNLRTNESPAHRSDVLPGKKLHSSASYNNLLDMERSIHQRVAEQRQTERMAREGLVRRSSVSGYESAFAPATAIPVNTAAYQRARGLSRSSMLGIPQPLRPQAQITLPSPRYNSVALSLSRKNSRESVHTSASATSQPEHWPSSRRASLSGIRCGHSTTNPQRSLSSCGTNSASSELGGPGWQPMAVRRSSISSTSSDIVGRRSNSTRMGPPSSADGSTVGMCHRRVRTSLPHAGPPPVSLGTPGYFEAQKRQLAADPMMPPIPAHAGRPLSGPGGAPYVLPHHPAAAYGPGAGYGPNPFPWDQYGHGTSMQGRHASYASVNRGRRMPSGPYRVLHSYNSPAYRGVPIWG